MSLTIWHNPRCSKSRQVLALIEDSGADVTIRKYLEDAPSVSEIEAARDALGLPLSGFVRRGEKLFRELGLKEANEAELLDAMATHPILIERPIVFQDNKAVLGRPPESVQAFL